MSALPESFEGMLADLADAAAELIPLPDAAAVRRRARERTVRRRLAASALALTVLAASGATVAAVAARRQPLPRGVGALATPLAAGPAARSAPAPSSGASAAGTAAGTAAAPDSAAGTGPYAAVAGRWRLVGGQRELLVYPDGVFGVGEAGRWALCDGRLKPLGDGTDFVVSVLACSDYGTAGMSLRVLAAGKELTLSVSGRTLTYVFVAPQRAPVTTAAGTAVAIKELAGYWESAGKDARAIVLRADGYVEFLAYSGTGVAEPFAGTVTGYYADAVRVEVPCAGRPVPGLGYCGVLQLEYDPKGLVAAVGGDGAEFFRPPSGAGGQVFGGPSWSAGPSAAASALGP